MPERSDRQSITPTYDHRETGDRFTVATRINGAPNDRATLVDPFVRTTVRIGFRDRLIGLFRGLTVEVLVDGDKGIVEDVLELNADYLGASHSTRRAAWNARMEGAMAAFAHDYPSSEDSPDA